MACNSFRGCVGLICTVVLTMNGCGGTGGGGGGSQNSGPALIADYCFNNSVGTEPYDLMVTLTGKGPGGSTFSQSATQKFRPPSATECVEIRIQTLAMGSWSVTAKPNGVGAPATCTVTVPGTIRLDVSQGTPKCIPGL
jgi:hypothetical protein